MKSNMTVKEFADMLDERQYGEELNREEVAEARRLGYVVLYGESDDLAEFEGAICDEADCYLGGTILLTADGIFKSECENPNCPYSLREQSKCSVIEAVWDNDGYAWTYQTDIPHETFDIYEDDGEQKYCRGIVFDVRELRKA